MKTIEPFLPESMDDIDNATRAQLVEYLERWCIQCYEHETITELREAARDNYRTEGC